MSSDRGGLCSDTGRAELARQCWAFIKDHWGRQTHSASFNLTPDWPQLGTLICSSESPINFIVLPSVASASLCLTEHKILRNRKGMYVPVMFVLVPDVWLGEKARKGRKEREQEERLPYIYQQQKGHTNTNCCIFKLVKYLYISVCAVGIECVSATHCHVTNTFWSNKILQLSWWFTCCFLRLFVSCISWHLKEREGS